MLCSHCGTDTPAPATACRACRTPFPFAPIDADTETVAVRSATPASGGARARTSEVLPEGTAFGARYRILRELGSGGMGVVYQAWDAELGVAVALKVIRPDVTADPQTALEVERRFKRELLLARQVTHKHVVRIHDLGEIDGTKYITMPYIEGQDLAHYLRDRGKLPVPEVLRLAKSIVAGLVAAHEAGVVHRDLKPENIMIDQDGHPLIMDFGISRSITTSTATATAAGAIVGTLEYMAPEQARGVAVDQRADIYALGLILHDMVAGRRRVARESALSEMMKRMQQPPPPLRSLVPEVPEAFERIIAKCLQIDPDARYATSAALLADLERLDPDGALARLPIARDYRWKLATATMIVLVMLSAGIAVWFARHRAAATAAPAVAHAPVSVLIADFENATGEDVFEGSLEQALAIAMEGSSFISVYPQKSARTLAAQLAPASHGRLSEETAQLISRREGVKVLLAGSIAAKPSGGFHLVVRAVDSANAQQIALAERDVASKADVLQGVAALSEQVRRSLDTSNSEMSRLAAAETFTAGSLEAMRAYARGQAMTAAGNYQAALQSLQEATKYDPKLGRAYSAMGVIYVNLKQTDRAEAAFKQAMDNMDRMSDREKYRTLAAYYVGVAGNYEKGIENYEQLIKAFPADNVAYGNLAFAYVRVGNVARAQEVARRGLEIYPRNLLQRTNYAAYSVYAGDFETAVREAERVLGDNPKYEFAYLPLALARAGKGDLQGARAAYAKLAEVSETGASLAALGIADLDLFSGRTGDAAARLRAAMPVDERLGNTGELAVKHLALAEGALATGQQSQAVAEARSAVSKTKLVNVLVPAARVLIAAGSDAAARDIIKDLSNRLQTQTSAYAEILEAELAIKAQDHARAIELLRSSLKRQDLWLGRFVLGRAYIEAGPDHVAEALDEFNKCYARRGEVMDVFYADSPTVRYLPPLYYWLGRANPDKATSAKWFSEYLKVRPEAPQDPLAADIRRRLDSTR